MATPEQRAARAAYARQWRKDNNAKSRQYAADRRANKSEAVKAGKRKYYQDHRAETLAQNARYIDEHRDAVRAAGRMLTAWYMAICLDHYGTKCACCGSVERLTIDHVDGNGKQHRAEQGLKSGIQYHRWLFENGFPPRFQTLCLPCNISKYTGAKCRLQHDSAT